MTSDDEASVEDEINEVSMKRPHVVILGAGVSRAALPSGDVRGKRIPLMNDLIEIVGLEELLDKVKIEYRNKNFEEIYSTLASDSKRRNLCNEIEKRIYDYFTHIEAPYKPTIYDHLVLSLRETDLVATFNWDPLLMEAYRRNKSHFKLPQVVFLHGNVSVGFCIKDKICGLNGSKCSKCGQGYTPSPLFFPITKKNYTNNEFINNEWRILTRYLENAFMITIFGYKAPESDVEAKKIMKKAWGEIEKRNMEQIEVIVKPTAEEEEVRATWNDFIHTHHYQIKRDFYDSWIVNHPRRTGEAYINQYLRAKFISNNPIPKDFSYMELWNWLKPLKKIEDKGSNIVVRQAHHK